MTLSFTLNFIFNLAIRPVLNTTVLWDCSWMSHQFHGYIFWCLVIWGIRITGPSKEEKLSVRFQTRANAFHYFQSFSAIYLMEGFRIENHKYFNSLNTSYMRWFFFFLFVFLTDKVLSNIFILVYQACGLISFVLFEMSCI